jgi:alanine racemase
MGTGLLQIDLAALAANWRALDAMTAAETAAVVKADGYGLGAARVAQTLATAGARRFFVAVAEEGAVLRDALGPGPEINVFSGHMAGDAPLLRDAGLTPMLNSPEQLARHRGALPDVPYGVQLDSGMNRLGMEPADWAATRAAAEAGPITLVMSHLACADEPGHPANAAQLRTFREMTEGVTAPRSLSATGGILLGPDYHFDLTRPGVGLYGGLPFADAAPVVRLSLPVIQVRDLAPVRRSATAAASPPKPRRKSQPYQPVTPTGSSAPCRAARRSGPGPRPVCSRAASPWTCSRWTSPPSTRCPTRSTSSGRIRPSMTSPKPRAPSATRS